MTLLDFPGKVACTVFFGGCNFRCPYCHNASLVFDAGLPAIMSESDFFSFLSKRRQILDGVCITGGEPLLQQDLALFILKIKEMGFLVKLDTNGSFPQRLKQLLEMPGVDYVAMDIKNSQKRYQETIGVPGFSTRNVEESIKILQSGAVPYEFRTTLVKEFHREEDILQIGEWLQGSEALYLQTFADSGNLVGGKPLSPFSKEDMEGFAQLLRKYVKEVHLRGM